MELDDYLFSGQIPLIGAATVEEIANSYPDMIADLVPLDPIETTATFSGLLTMPQLQSNCFRIETFVHLALAYCEGTVNPTTEFIKGSFEKLGDGYCGRMEDPSEDLFVSLIGTGAGNFRVFEGVWEGAAFHLQRIAEIVESMPNRPFFNRIRNSIESLLRLSDAVAERAGLQGNVLGQGTPLDNLPAELAGRLSTASQLITFNSDELARLNLSEALLSEFALNVERRPSLRTQFIGHSDLERRPVVFYGGQVYLLLPTAVVPAITRFVIESVISKGLRKAFERELCDKFAQLFYETPVLGNRLPALVFRRIGGGFIAGTITEVDPGRFLHLIFFVDGLDGFLEDGFNGVNPNSDDLSLALSIGLEEASAEATSRPSFRDGITLLVSCGFGRGMMVEQKNDLPKNWRLESISAHDLVTLSWLSDFDSLSLWRLLDSRKAIQAEGPEFLNVNGLLNLVAWSRKLGGHLVPHGELPDGFADSHTKNLIVVPQNSIRELRHNVATEWAPMRVLDTMGRWVKVRKLGRAEFEEDNSAPLYGSEEDARAGKLRAVYIAPQRPWWIEIAVPESSPRKATFEYWMMVCVWLRKAAPVLDRTFNNLPPGPVSFTIRFAEIATLTQGPPKRVDEGQLRSLIKISVDPNSPNFLLDVHEGFDDSLNQPANVAERILVEALVGSAAKASGENLDVCALENLVREICPNSEARWMHRFPARFFRDYIGTELNAAPALIDQQDDAISRIGLGWRIRSRNSSPEISGVQECTSYLNDLVKVVLDDFCGSLRSLDRKSLVKSILHNHEVAAHERDVWERTAQANLALRDNKEAAVQTIVEHISQLNACFVASRIVLEAAICECPLKGGRIPGKLDPSRAMAQAMRAYYLGSWSDVIRWGAMEARLRITPLGDVHLNHDFMDSVYQPFGRVVGAENVKRAANSYSKIYNPADIGSSFAATLESDFLNAWQSEFGVSLDDMRTFVGKLEDMALKPVNPVMELPRSALRTLLGTAAKMLPEGAASALTNITLVPRRAWRTTSNGFTDKDWFPWRFRRRLSVLRRPFIQVDDEADPTILFAPGIVEESLFAMARWFHGGGIPSSQVRSVEMSKWIGHANNVQRIKFNSIVADRMKELGWQVQQEIKLTKLLGRPLDRNYGDIDVLAWRPESGRVLAMECKDLQFHKTPGEIAEQLADFLGGVQSDGKPDHLRRHLNRVEVLVAHRREVSKKLKLRAPIQIAGHLVFKNPVPMRFAWDSSARGTEISLFTELDKL